MDTPKNTDNAGTARRWRLVGGAEHVTSRRPESRRCATPMLEHELTCWPAARRSSASLAAPIPPPQWFRGVR